jgi:hypothetical protein
MFTEIRISFRCGFAVTLSILTAWGLAPTTFGQAVADNWLNPNGGNYEDGSNWSLGAPGAYPLFNLGSSGYTIALSQNDSAVDPYIETDNPSINLNSYTYTTDYLDVSTAANTNGSLTFVGPGTYENVVAGSIPIPGYLDVGNGSNSAQFTVNDATVTLPAESTLNVAAGSTMTVENGGSVTQNNPVYAMNIANLVVNDGTVSTKGTINIASATLTNGGGISAGGGGGSGPVINVSGSVLISGVSSDLGAGGSVAFGPDSSLTIIGNGGVGCGSTLYLDGTVDLESGRLITAGTDLDAALTIELPLTSSFEGAPEYPLEGPVSIQGGSLSLTLAPGFLPAAGQEFKLINGSSIAGTFNSVILPPLTGGESWDTSDLYINGTISVVPEPNSVVLLFSAAALLRLRRRRAKY